VVIIIIIIFFFFIVKTQPYNNSLSRKAK